MQILSCYSLIGQILTALLIGQSCGLKGFPSCDEMFRDVANPGAFCAAGRVTRDCSRYCDPDYRKSRIFMSSIDIKRKNVVERPVSERTVARTHIQKVVEPEPAFTKPPRTAYTEKPIKQVHTQTPVKQVFTEKPVKQAFTEKPTKNAMKSKGCDGMTPCVDLPTANSQFKACCLKKNMPETCVHLCDYTTKTADMTKTMMTKKECSVKLLEPYLKCAAAENDNRGCCTAKGLLSGARSMCEPFCYPNMLSAWPQETSAAMKYISCLAVQGQIGKCHWAGLSK